MKSLLHLSYHDDHSKWGDRIVCDILDNSEVKDDDDHDEDDDDDGDGQCGDRGVVVINKQRAGQTETVCTPVLLQSYCIALWMICTVDILLIVYTIDSGFS